MDLWLILTLAELVWVLIGATVIILQQRSPASTWAWILGMAFLPIFGLMLYWLIGPLRLERRRVKRSRSRLAVAEALQTLHELAADSQEHLQLALVGIGSGQSPPLRANSMRLILNGREKYVAMLEAILAAKKQIHIEYYIWEPDVIGTRIRDAIIERARAGVTVRMIVDGAGSRQLGLRWRNKLKEAGVKFAWFNPVRLARIRRPRADMRTHRKILVCDGLVGFTGGMNIACSQSEEFGETYWRDTHLRLEGSAVWAIQRLFLEDWTYAAGKVPEVDDSFFPFPTTPGDHIVQIVGSGPDDGKLALHRVTFTAFGQATNRLWVTSPYVIPDEAILTALTTAALRGVDVRLLVPKKGDSRLVDLAMRSYYPALLDGGIKVFEYLPRFIHAKTVVADHDIAIVGTANLDNRSFRLNFELSAVVFDEGMNDQLATAFLKDLESSREVVAADLQSLPFLTRLSQSAARLMSPLL